MNVRGLKSPHMVRNAWLWIVALGVFALGACGGEPRQNVRIILPENGATFVQGVDVITFRAELATLSLTNPFAVGLIWVSSLDQTFHAADLVFELPAESLSVGQHSITVIAPVRNGTVSDDIRITVEAGGVAALEGGR